MTSQQSTILIVDDEPDLLEITQSYLEMEGFHVVTASDVRTALEILPQVKPDLIVSDITMPVMSGFDFFERVRAHPQFGNTPFIFFSGHDDPEHIRKGKELGSDDYITKPFDPSLLLSTIRGKLRRRQELDDSMKRQIETLKDQLFQVISHEMRTPLTSILGATEVLADGKESLSPQDFTDFLEMLRSGSMRLQGMVEDFLLVVKIESGQLAADMGPRETLVSPSEIVRLVVAGLKDQIEKKSLELGIRVPSDVVSLAVYLPHLEDILRRLIDNAIKFSPTGGTVEISAGLRDKAMAFVVRDHGPGMTPEQQAGLFQKFRQIDREKQEQQGSGLGLYIAQQLAQANGGTLTVDSRPGNGSSFTFLINLLAG